MTKPEELVAVSREGDVVTLTMQFAPHNLVGKPLLTALMEAVEKAHKDGARAIILRSGLRHFSAGAEIELFDNQGARMSEIDVCACLDALEQVPVPIIASMHGLALGGGLELALACDIIVAADSSKAGMVEVTLGLHPLMGAIQRVASRAGVARAREMALFGRRYDAATLERWTGTYASAPGGTVRMASSSWACDQSKRFRTASVATVTFMVQTNGSHLSVLSQKAATSP